VITKFEDFQHPRLKYAMRNNNNGFVAGGLFVKETTAQLINVMLDNIVKSELCG
jgi:hypothetical protein